MKKLNRKRFISLLSFLSMFIVSCSKDEEQIEQVNDTFNVTVINGYGSGSYKVGEEVHIWSSEMTNNQVFDNWDSSINLIENKGEWHNKFIMPAQNVTVTATLKTIASVNINYELMQGKNSMKNVHYFFPQNHKGVVFLLHGTGGNAQNWLSGFEYRAIIKDLIANNFAIIITEAEEITLNQDINGDGKLRWAVAPLDVNTNIDLANIKAITDIFYARGISDASKPRFSIGMSNGSSFSGSLSAIFQFKAGVGYCAPITQTVTTNTLTPFQFCMATNDANENVGATGNANALLQQQSINSRGICSKYYSHNSSPLYPERFVRTGDVTIQNSIDVFNELKKANLLDNKNYFIKTKEEIISFLQTNTSNFPVMNSLTSGQKKSILNQIEVTIADHEFFSDYNKKTISFLNNQCQ